MTNALLFGLFRYRSELKLVRLKMSEGGVYAFQASNGDASVNHTFTIFVISEYSNVLFEKVFYCLKEAD